MSGTLYFGDNLRVMRDYVKDESVDLIYLDPPFNSDANYNVLFRSPVEPATAQVRAFEDTWRWGNEAQAAFEDIKDSSPDTFKLLLSLKGFLGTSDVMAYLAMMAIRLVEMKRILKSGGSLYLHCDPTSSHYLKILLDGILGAQSFVNEISWRRTTAKADHAQGAKHFPRVRDVIFRYSKGRANGVTFNQPFGQYDPEYVSTKYKYSDPDGRLYRLDNLTGPGGASKGNAFYEVMGVKRYWRYSKDRMAQLIKDGRIIQTRPGTVPQYKRYLDEMPGVPIGDDWDDIRPINSQAVERLGYPTQKPLALLERIILASSNRDDVVLDPFCGCGTAIHAAERTGRKWIGIDVTYVAIKVIRDRIAAHLPGTKYSVRGIPHDEAAARGLAQESPHEFQNWAVAVLGGHPRGKGADRGIDGEIIFKKASDDYGRAIVSVKGGKNVSPAMVRELAGTITREGADFGVFVCLGPATKEMKTEAASAGRVELPGGARPRLQIVTAADLIAGPNIGVHAVLNTVSGAAEAKKVASKKRGLPREQDRRQKNMMLPLKGGVSRDAPRGKTLQLPLEKFEAIKGKPGRSRRAS